MQPKFFAAADPRPLAHAGSPRSPTRKAIYQERA
jgi:hypothetical protein